MPLYAIIGTDKADSLTDRLAVRPAHLARMEILKNEGRLILAGPFPAIDNVDPGPAGFTGSLIVAEFDDLAAAEHWASEDPYTTHGIFTQVMVKPFRHVLP
ncbi:YciI family protein [Chitinibacter sp. FCG-7]|uniref:YciI family protein n=1 Tax=Chitinibacter mangrovi TaxID=3153927 RepID=A0AAU7FD28_9NEIS|nr:YciI family protein [Chitinibacter sp. GC72]